MLLQCWSSACDPGLTSQQHRVTGSPSPPPPFPHSKSVSKWLPLFCEAFPVKSGALLSCAPNYTPHIVCVRPPENKTCKKWWYNPYSAGIDFRRQKLTSDVCRRHFLTSKVDSRAVKIKIFIDIQMNRKQLTKTFMMISNWIKPFGFYGLCKSISAL